MKHPPENIITPWLRKLGIKVSSNILKEQLKSHPDYPSLLSITDTLDYLGIENLAVETCSNMLHEIPVPFLAHVKANGGGFVIVENRESVENTFPGFFHSWSGVVLFISKTAGWSHPENDAMLKREDGRKKITAITVIAIAGILLASVWTSPGVIAASTILLAAAGLFVSCLIVFKDIGIENRLAAKVCGKENECEQVIHSKGSKLPFGIHWSDAGVIWFASMLLVLVFSAFSQRTVEMIKIISLLSFPAVPFIFFSVYYQWRIAKKWCRLCLVIVGLLSIQVSILLPSFFQTPWQYIGMQQVLFFVTFFVIVATGWYAVKKILLQQKKLEAGFYDGIRFKRNERVIAALLENQKIVDVAPWEHDLQTGNEKALVQITVACSAYCGPCAKAHKVLHALVQKYGSSLGLTVRFSLNAGNGNDKKTKAVEYILKHLAVVAEEMSPAKKSLYTREMLHNWFEMMDYEKFAAIYPETADVSVSEILKQNEEWIKDSDIHFTPSIFINGRMLPENYSLAEIHWIINSMTNMVAENADSFEAELQAV